MAEIATTSNTLMLSDVTAMYGWVIFGLFILLIVTIKKWLP